MRLMRLIGLLRSTGVLAIGMATLSQPVAADVGKIVHDAEHNILAAQHGERWAKEDAEIDAKLAEIRAKNGGRPPNIVNILLDDVGFGEIGMPNLDVIRGYSSHPNQSTHGGLR